MWRKYASRGLRDGFPCHRVPPGGRRAKALGLRYEARLCGLAQATKVAFVVSAEGFSPAATTHATKSMIIVAGVTGAPIEMSGA